MLMGSSLIGEKLKVRLDDIISYLRPNYRALAWASHTYANLDVI